MANKIECGTHGECEETLVCSHLVAPSAGLGFNRDEPSEEDPFPDALCDDCELIFVAHNGWTEDSEKLVKMVLLCSGCYERSRIRNTNPGVNLDELANLRWKCGTCEEWHTGPCLDFSYASPYYWSAEHENANSSLESAGLSSVSDTAYPSTFLDEDFCAIDGEHFFVRGIIHLPIIGCAETFRWGVWGSLSQVSFETSLKALDDPGRVDLPPMFSWLSNRIEEYPDTLNLKMYAHSQEPGCRPIFELEHTDHPLSQEYHHGITAERVKEIMMLRLDGDEAN